MSAPARPARGVLAAAGLIGVTTLAARVVGFGRWLTFSHSVGAGCVGEAYSTANVLPNVLFEVAAGGALAAVAVPLVAGALGRGSRAEADRTASALLTWALSVLLPLSLLLALLARPLVDLLYRGEDCPGGAALAAAMLVVFAPQVVLYGVGIVLAGVLQAHRRFLAAALAPLLSSLVVIATYLLYAALPGTAAGAGSAGLTPATAVLAVGTTLGVVVLSLPLLVPVARAGVRLRPTWRFPAGLGRHAARLALAGVLALAGQQVAVVVSFAVMHAHGSPGTVNVYQYVQAVYLLPYAVLAVPLATAAFPVLAEGAAAGAAATGATLARSLRAVLLAGALGAAVLAAAAGPVGAFFAALDASGADPVGQRTLAATGPALLSFAPGLLGFGAAALLTRALYVRGRPVAAALAVAGGWLVAGLVPALLLRGTGDAAGTLTALGWASSLGMSLAAVALLLGVRRAWGRPALAGSARTAAVGALGAVVGAAAGAVAVDAGAGLLGHSAGGWLASAVPAGVGLPGAVLLGVVAAAVALVGFGLVVALLDRPAARSVLARLTGARAGALAGARAGARGPRGGRQPRGPA